MNSILGHAWQDNGGIYQGENAEWKECNQEPQFFFWDNVGNLCKEDPYEFTSSQ